LIFGTDGVRARVGEGYLEESSIERIVAATASVLALPDRFPADFPRGRGRTVLVVRDTRESGSHLGESISNSFARYGHDVADVGVLPTPGAAWIAATWPEVTLGVVISASHNPAEYNGIKFVTPGGAKISPEFEAAVSSAYWSQGRPPRVESVGVIRDRAEQGREAYVSWLVRVCRRPERLQGQLIAVDCANGATYEVAPEVLRRLGMKVLVMGDQPDGKNINLDCGALHPERLAALVQSKGAALGFCFDGDGDRMIPVTAKGTVLDGDHVLFLAGKHLHGTGRLPHKTVVATIMSNVGLEIALKAEGLDLQRTAVGDRNVYLAMLEGEHPLGGEQSGHLIFMEDSRTGDGILAGLRLLDVLQSDSFDLDREAGAMRRFPQLLKNVEVPEKVPFEALPKVVAAVTAAEQRLGGEGRVVLRYSGTEPLARVMLEGPDRGLVEALVDSICDAIRESIPGS
jgi:phosphoglucosamine mutase